MSVEVSAGHWQRRFLGLVTFAVVILVIACLYLARSVLMPLALSILLTFVLAPVVSRLQQFGLSRVPAVLVVVTLVGLLVLAVAYVMTAQLAGLISDLPNYQDNISAKMHDLNNGRWQAFVEDFQTFLRTLNVETSPAVEPQPVRVVSDDPISVYGMLLSMLDPVLENLASAGLVVVLVIFMLINREDLRNRVITLAGQGRMAMTTKALDEAAQRLSRYLLMQLIINGSYGLGVAVGLLILGVPYAWLWGLLAGVIRYIPYIGPWLGALMPITLGVAVFEGWSRLLVLITFFVLLELFSNMVMEPLLYGQSIGVSEAALLVAVAFWTWLWGAVGLILSVPLTVCLVVLGKYVPALKCFDVLLGDGADISPALALYQRLLAKDQDEALQLMQQQLEAKPAAQVYDEILIPCLMSARRDEQADHLEEADFQAFLKGIRELFVEVDSASQRCSDEPAEGAFDPRHLLVGSPVRDDSEEIVLHLLMSLLDCTSMRMTVVASEQPMSDLVNLVEEQNSALVCLISLPPGGLAAACLMCRRLRARFPELNIVVGRWGAEAREPLREAGASLVGSTLQEVTAGIGELLQASPAPSHRQDSPDPAVPAFTKTR